MAVRIRLRRTGKRNAACHRIVVADSRSPRDGRFIEILGMYDPRGKSETVDLERADYWLSQGAQPSETVEAIIKRARAGIPLGKREQDLAAAEAARAAEAAADEGEADEGEAQERDAEETAEEAADAEPDTEE